MTLAAFSNLLGGVLAALVLGAPAAAPAARSLAAPTAAPAAAQRPPIRWDPIPYGTQRRSDMKAYADRHYGTDSYLLKRPRVIVEHMTQGSTFQSAWDTFAPNVRDRELGELPGVCSHFIVDPNGRIHQLVPLALMCRHTVGLNWTSIGIEHVGFKESGVMNNARMRQASLRLTNWLRCRYGIAASNVIGHNESLRSPYHRERVARLRYQTHDDWPASAMRGYRKALSRLAC